MDIPFGEALGFSSRGLEDKKMLLLPQEDSVAATVCIFVTVSEGDAVLWYSLHGETPETANV